MKRKYFYLLAGIVAMILFKEIGFVFATFMVLAFLLDTMFSKSYKPWTEKKVEENYMTNQKLKLSDLDKLK